MQFLNHFLLAIPQNLRDYFSSTLIYICEHSERGAVGLVVNKPSNILVNELLSQMTLNINRNILTVPILSGGPVSQNQCFVLHSNECLFKSSKRVTQSIFLSSGWDVLEAISEGKGPNKMELALGYAGWGGGQLEEEIARNIWLSCVANESIIFEAAYQDRLQEASNEIGVNLNLISPTIRHA